MRFFSLVLAFALMSLSLAAPLPVPEPEAGESAPDGGYFQDWKREE